MSESLSRRSLLRRAGWVGAALPLTAFGTLQASDSPSPFTHGVASGDPLPDGAILWTRALPASAEVLSVRWEVSETPAFETLAAAGDTLADAARDYTVKVDVRGLAPGRTWFYRFLAEAVVSPTGRFRTAPAGDQLSALRIGVTSCSCYYAGYFNAYARLADRDDLDLIVHCGDYLYDYPDDRQQVRIPADEIDTRPPETLEEFRRRYALFRSDPDLQRVHQQHAFATVWDNHDLTRRTADPADPVVVAAQQAFDEWMPNRLPDPAHPERIYRSLRYGRLLDLMLIETCTGRDTAGSDDRFDPARTLLGAEQRQFLLDAYSASAQRGTLWRMTVTPVMIGSLNLYTSVLRPAEDIIINDTQWDGFVAERNTLYGHLRSLGVSNNLFVAGDLHCSTASELTEDPGDLQSYNPRTGEGAIGVEFLPSSVSRVNLTETLPSGELLDRLANEVASPLLNQLNPTLKFCDLKQHGYGIVDLNAQRARFEFWWQRSITEPTQREWLGATLTCESGSSHLLQSR